MITNKQTGDTSTQPSCSRAVISLPIVGRRTGGTGHVCKGVGIGELAARCSVGCAGGGCWPVCGRGVCGQRRRDTPSGGCQGETRCASNTKCLHILTT